MRFIACYGDYAMMPADLRCLPRYFSDYFILCLLIMLPALCLWRHMPRHTEFTHAYDHININAPLLMNSYSAFAGAALDALRH